MDLTDLDIDPKIRERLRVLGYSSLFPPQEATLPHALEGRNIIAAVPTASGKSLIGYLALLRAAKAGQKGLLIVPLRALASEKYEDLLPFQDEGIRVALSTGDLDASGDDLSSYDIIVTTSEKADSLLRHNTSWLSRLSVLVADEIHLIGDPYRGPTLEMTVAKLRMINPSIQLIGLSATMKNSNELAEWLGAMHYSSYWRPVQLREGVYCMGDIFFTDNSRRRVDIRERDELLCLIRDALKDDGQVLVFVNTRRAAETAAEKYSGAVGKMAGGLDISEEASDVDEPETISILLNRCIRQSTAFHHAGLTAEMRRRVERLFRERKIRCLFATPTLAAGINLPARTVIVRDIHRYDASSGSVSIPVGEVKQMLGRAGRPRYDRTGEAIIYARNQDAARMVLEEYLLGEADEIHSQLTESSIRTHVLAAISTRLVRQNSDLSALLSETFFAHEYGLSSLIEYAESAIGYLIDNGMVRRETDGYHATIFGRRTSDLYLDPASAVMIRKGIASYTPGRELALLMTVVSTPDMLPLYARSSEYQILSDAASERGEELFQRLEEAEDEELFLSRFKTALVLEDWISERREQEILEKYSIYPGDLRSRAETATWLLSSAAELSYILSGSYTESIRLLALRMEKGVSERLLDLAMLRGIGRARALLLYTAGFRNRREIAAADAERLSAIHGIGEKLAQSIIRQSERARSKVPSRPQEREGEWYFE